MIKILDFVLSLTHSDNEQRGALTELSVKVDYKKRFSQNQV